MRQLTAFTRKEFLETVRSGKLLILTIVFVLFGIMNPAVAKMTPWMMEMMSESLTEAGMTVKEVVVTAQTSWTQFYKNIPTALIIFVLMFSGIFANEYQKGTLINMVTKGLKRWKVVLSKTIVMLVFWTGGYWSCYGITYGYNAYFWDNSVSSHLFFSAFCFYLIGVWIISLVVLASSFAESGAFVLLGTGGVFLGVYLLGMFPDLKTYLPAQLMDSAGLLTGAGDTADYFWGIALTCVWSVADVILSVAGFNRKML